MLISQVWVDLAKHDLAATLPDAYHVTLTGSAGGQTYLLQILSRAPGPARVAKAVEAARAARLPALLVAPDASPAARRAAASAGLSMLFPPESIGQPTRGKLITPAGDP